MVDKEDIFPNWILFCVGRAFGPPSVADLTPMEKCETSHTTRSEGL